MQVALIGSHAEDHIHIVDRLKAGGTHFVIKSYKRYGGVANLTRFMEKKGKGNISPWGFWFKTSPVTIIVDKANSERTILVEKDYAREDKLEYWDKIYDYEWCHIAYLDVMDHLTVDHLINLRSKNGIISVDFCFTEYTESEAQRLYGLLKYVDVIFMSGDTMTAFYAAGIDLSNYPLKDQIAITHGDSYIAYIEEDKEYIYEYKSIPNLNTLGAGDYFVAGFICQSLANFKPYQQIIKDAHEATVAFLMEKNDD